MSPVFAISFGAMLFALAATCTHVILYYGKDILRQLRASWTDHGKYHKYRQTKYRSVHWLVYFMLFAFSFGGALVVSQFHLVPLPWWALFLSLSIAAMMALPIGIIQAVTNNQISISVLLDAVCGAVYPGRPLASMLFKVYGTSMVSRSLSLVADMKLGDLIGVLINHGMLAWILNTKRSLLSGRVHDNTGGWDARNTKLFHSSAIIWNVIGAGGVFGSNSPYRPLLFVLLAGFLLPIPFYLLYRRYPNSAWRLVNLPLLALGANAVPRLPANFLVSSMVVAFVSQFVIRRLFNRAWKRYNYVIGAALDTGTQLAAIIVFTLLSSVVFPVWWGNAKPSAEHCNLALVAPNSALF
ncbi:OPT oligopeptide transporter protein-domain-containing protein [Syncephalis plumigaleata]|nr:OPT oligopeptide transporter protein-domain-containing protein [Syncephalis plumigaleata]